MMAGGERDPLWAELEALEGRDRSKRLLASMYPQERRLGIQQRAAFEGISIDAAAIDYLVAQVNPLCLQNDLLQVLAFASKVREEVTRRLVSHVLGYDEHD